MIISNGILMRKYPSLEVACLDEDYELVSDLFLSKVVGEYHKRCKWKPVEAKWYTKLFVKDTGAWNKRNDCEDHAFRFQQAARDYHYWMKHEGEGIAIGVVATHNHALNIVEQDGVTLYLDMGKRVPKPEGIRWIIF